MAELTIPKLLTVAEYDGMISEGKEMQEMELDSDEFYQVQKRIVQFVSRFPAIWMDEKADEPHFETWRKIAINLHHELEFLLSVSTIMDIWIGMRGQYCRQLHVTETSNLRSLWPHFEKMRFLRDIYMARLFDDVQ